MPLSGQGGQGVTLLNTLAFTDFTDLTRRIFKTEQAMVKPVAEQLFIKDTWGQGEGNVKRYEEFDTQTFARSKPEGVDAKKAVIGTGYYKDIRPVRRAMEIDITWEMRRFNRYTEIKNLITGLAWFVPQRKELDLTHRLTFGNAVSYVNLDGETVDTSVGDGLALFSSAHTLAFSAATYSNIVTGAPAFSEAGYESALGIPITGIMSNFGERRVMNFNVIWSGDDPATVFEIRRILESTTDTTQDNPGVINVFRNGGRRHIELPWLATTASGAYDATKRRWWGLAAVGQGQNGWQAYFSEVEATNMKTPSEGNNGENFHNDNWTYGTRGSYAIAVLSGRGIIASLVVST